MGANKKQAYIHQLYQHKGAIRQWGKLSWAKLFAELEGMDAKDRVFEGVFVDPIRRGDSLLLGLARPQNSNYMARLDEDGHVVDLLSHDEGEGGEVDLSYLQTSVALLLPVGDAVAFVHGSQQSPKVPSVLNLVRELHATEPDFHWAKMPLMDRGKIQKLKQGRGVDRFSTVFETNRDIFTTDGPDSIVTSLDGVADALGANAQIEITISLQGGDNNMSKREKFRDRIVEELYRLIPAPSTGHGATANVYSEDGHVEILELVAHKMQVAFEVPPRDNDRARYSELVDRLAGAEDEIVDLVRQSV